MCVCVVFEDKQIIESQWSQKAIDFTLVFQKTFFGALIIKKALNFSCELSLDFKI